MNVINLFKAIILLILLTACSKEKVSKRLDINEEYSINIDGYSYNENGYIRDFVVEDNKFIFLSNLGHLIETDLGGSANQQIELSALVDVSVDYSPIFFDKIAPNNNGGFLVLASSAQTRELISIILSNDYQVENIIVHEGKIGNYVLSDLIEIRDEILLTTKENNHVLRISKSNGKIVNEIEIIEEDIYDYHQFKIVEGDDEDVKILRYYELFTNNGALSSGSLNIDVYNESFSLETSFELDWGASFYIQDGVILNEDLYMFGSGIIKEKDNQLNRNSCFSKIKQMDNFEEPIQLGSFLNDCNGLECEIITHCQNLFPFKNGFLYINKHPEHTIVGTIKKNGKSCKEMKIENSSAILAKKASLKEYYVLGYTINEELVMTKITLD